MITRFVSFLAGIYRIIFAGKKNGDDESPGHTDDPRVTHVGNEIPPPYC